MVKNLYEESEGISAEDCSRNRLKIAAQLPRTNIIVHSSLSKQAHTIYGTLPNTLK